MKQIHTSSPQRGRACGRIVALSLAGLFLMLPAQGSNPLRVGAYDFDYALAGDMAARPVQVFDDGRSTYMQFSPGSAIPAIFSTQSGAPQLLVPTVEGPYARVAQVQGPFVLQIGRARAQVSYAGLPVRPEASPAAAPLPSDRLPDLATIPAPHEGVLVASLGPLPRTLLGTTPALTEEPPWRQGAGSVARNPIAMLDNLQSYVRQGVLKPDQAEAIARGHGICGASAAAAPAATANSPASSVLAGRSWDMRRTDVTVENMLSRWAAEAGWTVVWRDAPRIAITGDAALPPSDFVGAADMVVRRAQEVGYRLSASAYSNKTLVVSLAK